MSVRSALGVQLGRQQESVQSQIGSWRKRESSGRFAGARLSARIDSRAVNVRIDELKVGQDQDSAASI